jgi:hypothetical protein
MRKLHSFETFVLPPYEFISALRLLRFLAANLFCLVV